MNDFFSLAIPHTAPIAVLFIAILTAFALSLASRNKGAKAGGIALLVSLIGARLATGMDETGIAAGAMILAFLICVLYGNFIVKLVGLIYIPRVALISLDQFGVIDSQTMWYASEIPLIIQILLVIYGASVGGGVAVFNRVGVRISRFAHAAYQLSAWVQTKVDHKSH